MGGQMSLMDERLRVRASHVSKVHKINKSPKAFNNVLGIKHKKKYPSSKSENFTK